MNKQAALLLTLLLSTQLGLTTWAESIQDKKNQLNQVQQQMEQKNAQRQAKTREVGNAVERLLEAQTELAQAQKELAQVEHQQQALSIEIRQNEEALAVKQKAYEKTRAMYKKRLRDIYENGQINYLDVLLGAADFQDFSSRMYLLQRIIQRDFALIDKVETQRKALLAEKSRLDAKKRELDNTHKLVTQKKQLVAEKTKERQRLYQQALAEKAQLDAEYEALQRSSAQITAMIKRMEEKGRLQARAHGTGQLSWPLYGPITSPFGWRIHPIFKSRIFHSGVDIGADYGEPIHAADSGRVIFAGWMGGYGNAVMIDHGGGMVTLYGHNSSFTVGVGQSVAKGQTIALAGSTGNSTGPHCHFEVRLHGEVTNPLRYLP